MASVLVARRGQVGRITLNRPEALNALTLEMVRTIGSALTAWKDDPAVRIVIIDSASEKAFCAGGDIRAISASGKAGDGLAQRFWQEEYRLNAQIACYGKPTVAIMDGITMGGGVGIGVHASHRIVTDTTVMAMPEVSIGFFPDVGGTWLLSRTPGAFGTFAALTAHRLSGADAIASKLADAYLPRHSLSSFVEACHIFDFSGNASSGMSTLLFRFARGADAGYLESNKAWIDPAFGEDSVEAILDGLAKNAGKEAQQVLVDMSRHSPTSLNLTLRALREARGDRALEDSRKREFRIACRCIENSDFYEGIRAAVIDKDRSPKWKPPTLSDVTESFVEQFFAPLGSNELRFDSD